LANPCSSTALRFQGGSGASIVVDLAALRESLAAYPQLTLSGAKVDVHAMPGQVFDPSTTRVLFDGNTAGCADAANPNRLSCDVPIGAAQLEVRYDPVASQDALELRVFVAPPCWSKRICGV
jgi:hypothetical protein